MTGERATAGLILAAGAGTRFGQTPKQLADLHGAPLLQWAIDAQLGVPALRPVVVVLGARAAEIRAAIDLGDALAVDCADWERGQSASLRRGLEAVPAARRVLVTLGDAPLVTSQAIARFVEEPRGGVRATYGGRPGHPVLLGSRELRALAGNAGDHGAREVIRGARTIEVGHLCSGRDVDTPEDLEEIRDEARALI